MAAGHFDTRKQIILEEVNAIGTAYLRASLIQDKSQGEHIRGLLRQYVAIRVRLSQGEDTDRIVEESEAVQSKLWQHVELIALEKPPTVIDGLLVQAINEVFDYHQRRVTAGLHFRIPATVWTTLYAILVLSILGMGYSLGLKGTRNFVGSIALALSFAVMMFLIADLDRPLAGLVVSDQSAMQSLQQQLNRK
jgi:hypothetical protein